MEILKKIYNNKIITIFMILQPLVDVMTYFMKVNLNFILTFGMIIRIIFFVYMLIYLIFFDKFKKSNNYIYIGIVFIVFLSNIILNYYTKGSYNFLSEIKNIIKICYFPFSLLFFVKYNKNNDKEKLSIDILSINIILISLVLLISKFTGTQFCSYSNTIGCIDGSSGWFYSANELSMILVLLFPICLYKFIKSKFSFFDSIVLILAIYSILEIGTKSAYIGLISTLVVYLFLQLIKLIKHLDKDKLKNICAVSLVILMIFIITPGSSVCYNNFQLFEKYNVFCKIPMSSNTNENLEKIKNYVKVISGEGENDLILNGREEKLKEYEVVYKKTTLIQKTLGIGYGNYNINDTTIDNIIERDFHDLFYEYGYLGFVIILLPLVFYVGVIIFKFLKKPINIFNDENIILVGVFMCVFGAYISGHVLFASAVTTYLGYILGIFSSKTSYK